MPFLKRDNSPDVDSENIPDNLLVEREFEGGGYEYIKKLDFNGKKYFIRFEHQPSQNAGELSLHFGLDNVNGDPITNAGLGVFGAIADEMSSMYEEIMKSKEISRIRIFASPDTFSEDDLTKIKEIIASDPSKLDKITFINEPKDFEVSFRGGTAEVITDLFGKSKNPPPPYRIPITPSILEDLKHIAKVDISEYIPEMINQINGADKETKKQNQRLKLYQRYLQRRYPRFTFNSKEVTREDGKKDVEFEKNENDQPYLLVTTNN
jgi:hypothetical protein